MSTNRAERISEMTIQTRQPITPTTPARVGLAIARHVADLTLDDYADVDTADRFELL